MNLYFRLLCLLFQQWRSPKSVAPLAACVLKLRVYPNDLDVNAHVNNGRYLTYMDLGRTQLVLQTGLAKAMRANRWYPVVASCKTHFLKELKCFESFEVKTRVVYWDDKWIYLSQSIRRLDGTLVISSLFKTAMIGKGGRIPSQAVLDALPDTVIKPECPAPLLHWIEAEQASKPYNEA